MLNKAQRNIDETACARKITEQRAQAEYDATPDDCGISNDMLNIMLRTVAEGLRTGSNDMRSLLYCAYRNARERQKRAEREAAGWLEGGEVMKHLPLRFRILRVVLLPVTALLLTAVNLGLIAEKLYDWLFDVIHRKNK